MSSQVGDCLVPEGVGRGLDSSLQRVSRNNLLDSSGAEPGIPASLEEPAVGRVGGNMRA